MDLDSVSVHKHAKKELRQYPAILTSHLVNNPFYYMAVSHKDWELPNSRTWLAEIDIDRSLDFPI